MPQHVTPRELSARLLLRRCYSYDKCCNLDLVDALGVLHIDSLLAGAPAGETSYYAELGRHLISFRHKVSSPQDVTLSKHHEKSRPREFDLDEMILRRGIIARADEIRMRPDYIEMHKLAALPFFGLRQAGEVYRQLNKSGGDPNVSVLSKWKEALERKNERTDEDEAQLLYIENPPSDVITCENAAGFVSYVVSLTLTDPVLKEYGITLVPVGSLDRGRFKGHNCEVVLFFEDKPTIEIVNTVVDRLEELGVLSCVFHRQLECIAPPVYCDPPTTAFFMPEYVPFVRASIPAPNNETSLVEIFFAARSNRPTIEFFLTSSASYGDALYTAGLSRELVIHPLGVWKRKNWTPSGRPEVIKDEREIWDLLSLAYRPPDERCANLSKDTLPWIGLTDVELEARKESLRKAEEKAEAGKGGIEPKQQRKPAKSNAPVGKNKLATPGSKEGKVVPRKSPPASGSKTLNKQKKAKGVVAPAAQESATGSTGSTRKRARSVSKTSKAKAIHGAIDHAHAEPELGNQTASNHLAERSLEETSHETSGGSRGRGKRIKKPTQKARESTKAWHDAGESS
ncbi:hypothetical protein JCM10212_006755 [Sporobolomyces blumeae]